MTDIKAKPAVNDHHLILRGLQDHPIIRFLGGIEFLDNPLNRVNLPSLASVAEAVDLEASGQVILMDGSNGALAARELNRSGMGAFIIVDGASSISLFFYDRTMQKEFEL